MKRISFSTLLVAQAFFALAAKAHPGHSLGDHGLQHVITSPYHVTMLTLAGAGLLLAARFVQHRLPRRLLQGAGIAAFLAAVLVWGIG